MIQHIINSQTVIVSVPLLEKMIRCNYSEHQFQVCCFQLSELASYLTMIVSEPPRRSRKLMK